MTAVQRPGVRGPKGSRCAETLGQMALRLWACEGVSLPFPSLREAPEAPRHTPGVSELIPGRRSDGVSEQGPEEQWPRRCRHPGL